MFVLSENIAFKLIVWLTFIGSKLDTQSLSSTRAEKLSLFNLKPEPIKPILKSRSEISPDLGLTLIKSNPQKYIVLELASS